MGRIVPLLFKPTPPPPRSLTWTLMTFLWRLGQVPVKVRMAPSSFLSFSFHISLSASWFTPMAHWVLARVCACLSSNKLLSNYPIHNGNFARTDFFSKIDHFYPRRNDYSSEQLWWRKFVWNVEGTQG